MIHDLQVCGLKRLSYYANCQEVSKVAPEVNLGNPQHAGNEACKPGIHPGFESQERHHKKSKPGVSVVPQKGLMSSKRNLKSNTFN